MGYQMVSEDLGAMLSSLTVCKGMGKTNQNGIEPPLPTQSQPPHSEGGKSSIKNGGEGKSFVPVVSSEKSFVIALYDFDAQAEGDLSFRRDERIEVLERKEVI